MKEKVKTFLSVCLLLGALPYIVTVLFQGKSSEDKISIPFVNEIESEGDNTKNTVPTAATEIDIESYLAGVVAKEISLTYEMEALKAQAVAARTNLLIALENEEELPPSLSQEELLSMWGHDGFSRNYQRITEAVTKTKGIVITYEGEKIYAAYHAVSAGHTRMAKDSFGYEQMPWLNGVKSAADIQSEDFLKVVFFEPEKIREKLVEAFPEAEIPESDLLDYLKIVKRDSQEYVLEVKLGEETITGEEFRELLGLNSACFYLADVEGDIRIVTKGLGHGLGMSQFGANEMAKKKKDFKEILNYYYKNIQISD